MLFIISTHGNIRVYKQRIENIDLKEEYQRKVDIIFNNEALVTRGYESNKQIHINNNYINNNFMY